MVGWAAVSLRRSQPISLGALMNYVAAVEPQANSLQRGGGEGSFLQHLIASGLIKIQFTALLGESVILTTAQSTGEPCLQTLASLGWRWREQEAFRYGVVCDRARLYLQKKIQKQQKT